MNDDNQGIDQLDVYDGDLIPPSLSIKAMRDSGYRNTAYALAELIDNSIQANADLVEVFCIERPRLINQRECSRIVKIGVLDNGSGMDEITLRLALQFGNGTHLNDRRGIGRFGMGLPNASISQCRHVDVWTWQAGPDNAIYTYLDLNEIEKGEMRKVPPPQPKGVPREWHAKAKGIGTSGTLVVWSSLDEDRLMWRTGSATLKNTGILVGRIYRKFINEGKTDIRLVEIKNDELSSDKKARVNDPCYLMSPSSTPKPFESQPMFQKWGERDTDFDIAYKGKKHKVWVRMSYARLETLSEDGTDRGHQTYGKHAGKNIGVSIVRGGRELELDDSWAIGYDPRERWWGVEVEFPPSLDEVFGVTNNKQNATVFSQMAHFNWENERESGEEFMDFKRRLEEEENPRVQLIDIADHIRKQLSLIRKSLHDQMKGRRRGRRHEDVSIEDTATAKWKERYHQGHITPSDTKQFDNKAQKKLTEDLRRKNYNEEDARKIASAVESRGRKVIFVTADNDSQAFFNVEEKPGGITEVTFNKSHPAYEKLVKTLDPDIDGVSDSNLKDRIENASDTLKLLFAAWARYEEEDVPNKRNIRNIRHEWGKMADNFLSED